MVERIAAGEKRKLQNAPGPIGVATVASQLLDV
jgi:hypothetical protein